MARSGVVIIIPALNEQLSIGTVIVAARGYGSVIVVDDGSSDMTRVAATAAGARVVRHELTRGYDAALNSGFQLAEDMNFDLAITMDADGQHNPEMIPFFIETLAAGADVVVGVRNQFQRFAERLFSYVARARWRIRDPLCGMKGYRMEIYRQLGHFDSYRSIGTELAIFASTSGKQIEEILVQTRKRYAGQSRFGHLLRSEFKIARALLMGVVRYGFSSAG